MSWCCTPRRAALLASAPAAVCRVPAAGVGGRAEPSRAKPVGLLRISSPTGPSGGLAPSSPPGRGHKFSSPRLLVTQEPLCLT